MTALPTIHIYNTLSRNKEALKTHKHGNIGLYVCGMTVYDYCHLGHARVMSFFDTAVRYLRHQGYTVHFVRNITDIDDKIFVRAQERNCNFQELTASYITAMHEDFTALGFIAPDDEPKVTDYIEPIIELILQLIKRNYAYETNNGDVYYRVKKFASYGKLSGKKIKDLRSGVRIEANTEKEDSLDFALWKSAKTGEASWQSPWGMGRPGWHIECSAMSMSLLGKDFDIHGGGPDLVFPHHENEIAQSCGAYDCNYASYWMHVAPLRVADAKMSKSLNNFFTIRDILQEFPAEHVRFFLTKTHYRTPIQFDKALITEAGNGLDRIYQSLQGLHLSQDSVELASLPKPVQQQHKLFHRAMQDDLNTPQAIAALFALTKIINTTKNSDSALAANIARVLVSLGNSIGLLQKSVTEYFTNTASNYGIDTQTIERLIQQRNQAKQNKNFAEADAIRDQLEQQGVALDDQKESTSWKYITRL